MILSQNVSKSTPHASSPAHNTPDGIHVPSPSKGNIKEDGRPAYTAEQSKRNDGNGKRDNPVDVLDKEDLVRGGMAPVQGRHDNRKAEIRRHGEVGDSTDEQRNGEEVMEDLLAMARLEAESEVDKLVPCKSAWT